MCAGCNIANIPVCAASGLCSANVHQFIQMILISSGASAGSILVWLKTRIKK
jgi:hypothetical protein